MNIHIAQFSVLSESGRRPHNEDAVYPNSLESAVTVPNLYIVADGIGGKGKGDAASRITIESFAQYFAQNPPTEEALSRVYVDNALRFAENAFDEYIKVHPECWGMGATIVLLYANSAGVSVAWAGNCRAYQYRKAEQLYRSNDHTEVNVLLRDGRITEDEAQIHPRRHSILRAIQGSSYPTQMDTHFIGKESIFPGDVFFLCSDGVLEGVSEAHLSTAIDLQSNTDLLLTEIKTYCQAESSDNYACVILRMEDKDVLATAPVVTPPLAVVTHSPVLWDDDDDEAEEMSRDIELVVENEPEDEPIVASAVVNTPPTQDTPTPPVPPVVVETPVVVISESPKVATTPPSETPYIQPPFIHEPSIANNNPIPPASGNHLKEEKKDNSGMLALAVLVFTGILVALLAWAWSGSGKGKGEKSYQDYMALATESQKASDFDKAILYLDSATHVNKGASESDSRLRIELVEKKRAADKLRMIAQGDKFANFNKYPDYIRAINTYEDAIRNYGDNGGIIQGKIANVKELMGKSEPTAAFQELLVEASNMCKEGNTLDANVFMEAATKFKSTAEQQKSLNELKGQCTILANAAQKGGTTAPTVASNERSVGERTVANPINHAGNEAATKKTVSPEPKTKGTNSSAAVVENGAIDKNTATSPTNPAANARKSAPDAIVTADMSNLQKGKAYFRDANNRKNCDSYESALNFLEKANNAKQLDGEGAYMAAIISYEGHCELKNSKKALEYANRSAFLEYTNGQYLYGKLLLNKKVHTDSVIAKGFFGKAAAKGHTEAKTLAQRMWKIK